MYITVYVFRVMLLRSGIILPFQFREHKKLIMVGGPEENRNLSLWDLKNVVRAAFGIYNFEFRNKKIDFNIPDDLLLNYLAQRRDLTNFVIEIRIRTDETQIMDTTATSVDNKLTATSTTIITNNSNSDTCSENPDIIYNITDSGKLPNNNDDDGNGNGDDDACNNNKNNNDNSHHSTNNQEPAKKIPKYNGSDLITTTTQSLDTTKIVLPKIEISHDSNLIELKRLKNSNNNYNQNNNKNINTNNNVVQQQITTVTQHINQQQLQQQEPHFHHNHAQPTVTSSFFSSYNTTVALQSQQQQQQQQLLLQQQQQQQSQTQQQQQNQFYITPNSICFRRRGERMSKDQKEIYVKYFEENPCMLSQRRNDIVLEPYWTKLAGMLNSVPQGAVKNVEEWKQTFDAWRYRVFMYSRYNTKLSGSITQNPKNYKPLTVTDQRAYAMWTSHKHTPQDFEKLDMFTNMDESQTAFDY